MPRTITAKQVAVRTTGRANKRRRAQAIVLLILGVVILVVAGVLSFVLHRSTNGYPVGVLLFGVGLLVAATLNLDRLVSAGLLITMVGVAVFLSFGGAKLIPGGLVPAIPGNQILVFYILALGLGLLGIALMARRRYVGRGSVTPALIVIGVGMIEYFVIAAPMLPHFIPFGTYLTSSNVVAFGLSLWLPGIGLFLTGLVYLVLSFRKK